MLAVEPADRILEVGCGHGVAVSLICERLEGGHVTAIDRSATMIAAAAKRNREYVASGKATFEVVAIEDADLGADRFDKVFAVHVAAFWTRPGETLPVVRRALVPGGSLFLFGQAPGWRHADQARSFGESVARTLTAHGFASDPVVTRAVGSTHSLCVQARPVALAA
jgi:SAM-dependent methyltransferase